MIGDKFNNWTVLEYIGKGKKGASWKCCCNCGNEQIKTTSYLNHVKLNQQYKGCRLCEQGSRQQEEQRLITELLKKQVGDWTVLDLIGKNKYGSRYWLCRCKCGNERKFLTAYLTGNGKRSATKCKDCELRELEEKNRIFSEIPDRFWNKFLHTAQKRNYEVVITKKDALNKFLDQGSKCALTRIDLYFTNLTTNYHRYTNASIDRIDSSLPYTLDNIQWVEKRINMMKQQYSQNEFIELCKLVASNLLI